MGNRTPLYEQHIAAGGKMVDFGGWDMPLHYGSQLNEHRLVRNSAGVFDVSHMTVVDIQGADAKAYLQNLLANDVAKLKKPGKALYSAMLNENAGVVDDLIVYFFTEQDYRLVVNAGTRDKDMAWLLQQQAGFEVQIIERPELAMLAVQGPEARAKVAELLPGQSDEINALGLFMAIPATVYDTDWLVARTGYTGEDGVEIIMPADSAVAFWEVLLTAGIEPCGLGARDTLRMEAGMALYGQDMDDDTSPLAAGMGWTLAWQPEDRQFIGRDALQTIHNAGQSDQQIGLVLEGRGVLRHGQKITDAAGLSGEVTSGGFAPTLDGSIALARVPAGFDDSQNCTVDIRGRSIPARIVKPPFVRNGKVLV